LYTEQGERKGTRKKAEPVKHKKIFCKNRTTLPEQCQIST
jgi:hypothetical protein